MSNLPRPSLILHRLQIVDIRIDLHWRSIDLLELISQSLNTLRIGLFTQWCTDPQIYTDHRGRGGECNLSDVTPRKEREDTLSDGFFDLDLERVTFDSLISECLVDVSVDDHFIDITVSLIEVVFILESKAFLIDKLLGIERRDEYR